ncbi:uncharacterized protein SPPG_07893 [Spizellomyces punctatus DAOM BR117]|uniref:HOOK N-terminal domain-containing protein n=1 Tax=Spizellomyces punctatus (strain DAOM BR117) TaxID=645134 RepID=A0A0L0H599_SPIPD|nr:uncharacterized protein SPPG_07893 [Spizellomyces punctatus DAOM BR117]KNC96680.1 hypothetical protein SPPG_07893 [Spizellomyces punctatus DAOM BR117]|eukprot:XP_016604720.1 hypothetical protein SPPG_07893 [Spizellomyces punctatus DAOM BR117]
MAAAVIVDTDCLADAVVEWVNTFDSISRPCRSIKDLADAVVLTDILSQIDPQWFKAARAAEYGDNWVLRFNGLKKLHKLLMGYYEEVLGQNSAGLETPNLTAIARDADILELLKLAQLVIALAVQCENNQRYVMKIQSLSQDSQHALMLSIETVMGRLANSTGTTQISPSTIDADMEGSITAALMAEKLELEKSNNLLSEEMEDLRTEYERVLEGRKELQHKINDMEKSLSQLTEAGQVDFILRTEIDNLKADLVKSENRRVELENLLEKQTAVITDMTRKVEETSRKAEEVDRLKDALDEFRHVADKLQKSEAIIDKYKKRFEEVTDLRRQLKLAEEQNQQHALRNAQLEEEFRKVAGIKPLVDTLKNQLSASETKNSSLQVEASTLAFQLTEARSKLERYDLEKRSDQELIQILEDRLKDMEHHSSGNPPLDREISEAGGGAESAVAIKMGQLEREVERLRADNASAHAIGAKVILLENLLEDANRLKAKFEEDYRVAHEKNIAFEKEVQELRSSSDRPVDSATALSSERQRASVDSAAAEPLRKQVKQLSEQLRQSMGQINKMAYERDKINHDLMDAKSTISQQERMINELRSDLAAMESRGQSSDESVQKIAAITKQAVEAQHKNEYLHSALKSAKEHIRMLDNQVKEYAAIVPKDDNFAEAIASLQSALSECQAENARQKQELADTRAAAKREQMLMASAWYKTATELQLKASARLKSATPDSPKSWLARERQKVIRETIRR